MVLPQEARHHWDSPRSRLKDGRRVQMTLDQFFTVRVERQAALANAMDEMREWLDNTRLQPVQFKVVIADETGIAFDITFQNEAEASQFAQAFA